MTLYVFTGINVTSMCRAAYEQQYFPLINNQT